MARPRFSRNEIIANPTRRAVLAHLIESGGRASAVQTCTALAITHRQTLVAHARLLARAGLVRLEQADRGNRRASFLVITINGRDVLAPQMPP